MKEIYFQLVTTYNSVDEGFLIVIKFFIPLALLVGFGSISNAGQISVINPSAGVSISISMPSASSVSPSSSSTSILPSSNSSADIGKKEISVFVLNTLETTNISIFSTSQLKALLDIIESGLERSYLGNEARDILLAEQAQLIELIGKKK